MSVDTWEQGDQPDQADQPPSTVNNDTKNLDLHPHKVEINSIFFLMIFYLLLLPNSSVGHPVNR